MEQITMQGRLSLKILLALLILAAVVSEFGLCSLFLSVQALASKSSSTHRKQVMLFSSIGDASTRLWAKPPPVSQFDLKAIEELETQLEMESFIDVGGASVDDIDIDDENDDYYYYHGDDNTNESKILIQEFLVPKELDNKRLDVILSTLEPSLSRSVFGNLISDGKVILIQRNNNTRLNRKSQKISAGTILKVEIPREEKPLEIVAQDIPLDILYEDEHMIVLNKEAGMVVHPAAGNWDGTVVNALAYYLSNSDSPYGSGEFVENNKKNNGFLNRAEIDPTGADGETTLSFRPGIVHRLDKGTTGVLIVAKTTQALGALSASFASRNVKKTYLAITVGNPGKSVVIDKPIGRHPIHRQRMRVVPDPHRSDSSSMLKTPTVSGGRRAVSYVDTLAFDGKLSLVQVRIETGRTHQIRVHLQDRHTPIYGDDVYGIPDWNKRLSKTHAIERPLLHAYRLEVDHPVSGERMVFTAPMAADMKKIGTTIWQSENSQDDLPEMLLI